MAQEKKKKKKIRHEIKITKELIVKTVATNTSLTKSQVKECLDTTWEIIEYALLQPDAPIYFDFIMGNLGKLTIKPHTGRKAGVYKRPNNFGKGKMLEEIVEEEEPSYQNLSFEQFPTFKENLNTISRERSLTQKWYRDEIIGRDENNKKIKKVFNYKGWLARNGEYYPIEKLDDKEVDDGR